MVTFSRVLRRATKCCLHHNDSFYLLINPLVCLYAGEGHVIDLLRFLHMKGTNID